MIQCDGCKREITTGRKDGKPQETDVGAAFNPPAGLGLPATHLCMKCTAEAGLALVDLVLARREEERFKQQEV